MKLLEARYAAGLVSLAGSTTSLPMAARSHDQPADRSESTPVSTSLIVVQHFNEELKRLVPAKP